MLLPKGEAGSTCLCTSLSWVPKPSPLSWLSALPKPWSLLPRPPHGQLAGARGVRITPGHPPGPPSRLLSLPRNWILRATGACGDVEGGDGVSGRPSPRVDFPRVPESACGAA